MILQRGLFHPSQKPPLEVWQERYHQSLDDTSALQLLPTRGMLARRFGTEPIRRVRLIEAAGNYEEVLDVYVNVFELSYRRRDMVECLVACRGVARNLARLDRSNELPDHLGPIFTDVTTTGPEFNRLTSSMAKNYWRTEPPIAIEVKEHPWSRRPEIHEIGPFAAKPNQVLAAIALHEAGVVVVN